jgi:hypothetical protein
LLLGNGAARGWGITMDVDFLLRLTQRVRETIPRACTEIAREQLRVWAEEFEEQAAGLKPELDAEPLTE